MVIQLTHVSKTFRTQDVEVKALKDCSISIRRGELLSVTGRSGSGKSTLLNIIGGLMPPDPISESVQVNGTEVYELKEPRLTHFRNEHIGFVFQTYNLIPNLTALENIVFPQRMMKKRSMMTMFRCSSSESVWKIA